MIPGPYSICHVTFPDGSDACSYHTLLYGFDTALGAHAELERIASERGLEIYECAVIRNVDLEEAADFST